MPDHLLLVNHMDRLLLVDGVSFLLLIPIPKISTATIVANPTIRATVRTEPNISAEVTPE